MRIMKKTKQIILRSVKSHSGIAMVKTSGTFFCLVILLGISMLTMNPLINVQTVQAASTYYVDDDGNSNGAGTIGDPFDDIQDALDVAGSNDVIEVRAGTYEENIVISIYGLKIEAYQGEPATIRGDHNSDTVTIVANNVQFLDIDNLHYVMIYF